ncbi:MAG TPA: AMP-binding protein [Acidimicrobiia bacterium]|nr:AMP-binding protein [Acidimicrobiia bacterium]
MDAAAPAWARHLPSGVDPASLHLTGAGSLPAAWAQVWAADPSHPVVGEGNRWLQAAELEELTRRVAGRYRAAGLVPGDRIVVSATPSLDLVVAHVAALRAGLVVVPVNAAYRAREVGVIVRDCSPAAAVVGEAAMGGWVADASARPIVVCSPEVELADAPVDALDAGSPDDLAMLCYTSGTTGAPKGARLTHANVLASPEALRLAWRWTPDDRLVLALPLFHMHGLGVGLHGTLLAGASAYLVPRFDPDTVLDAATAEHGTMFFGVPTMYERLARSSRVRELARLRLCVSGSAPLAPSLCEQFRDAAGVDVLERYGMTETLMTVSNPYDGERRPGTVGFPLPGVDLRLGDGDEILVRGPNVFPGYWERPDANTEAFEVDASGARWFHTGDIGAHDADGYLAIVGRAKELIISGGFNVYPREVEDVLRDHTGVADVAVIGTPSDEWGEVVTAVVVTDGPLDTDALLAFAAEQLAPYKRPRVVRVVDELPRNALGKVLRHEL